MSLHKWISFKDKNTQRSTLCHNTYTNYTEPKQPVNDVDVDAAVASTEVGRVYSFADSDMKSANGINHTQIVKKAST